MSSFSNSFTNSLALNNSGSTVQQLMSLDAFANQANTKEAKELLEIAQKIDRSNSLMLMSAAAEKSAIDQVIAAGGQKGLDYQQTEVLRDVKDMSLTMRSEAIKAAADAKKLLGRFNSLKQTMIKNSNALVASVPNLPPSQKKSLQASTVKTQNFVSNALANVSANKGARATANANNISNALNNAGSVSTPESVITAAANNLIPITNILNDPELLMRASGTIKGKKGGTAKIVGPPPKGAKLSEQSKNLTAPNNFRAQLASGARAQAYTNKIRASEFR